MIEEGGSEGGPAKANQSFQSGARSTCHSANLPEKKLKIYLEAISRCHRPWSIAGVLLATMLVGSRRKCSQPTQ